MMNYNDIYTDIPVFDFKLDRDFEDTYYAWSEYIGTYSTDNKTIPMLIARQTLYLINAPTKCDTLESWGHFVELIDHKYVCEGWTGIYARIYFNKYLRLPLLSLLDMAEQRTLDGFIGVGYLNTDLKYIFTDHIKEAFSILDPAKVMMILAYEMFIGSPVFLEALGPYVSKILYTEPYIRAFIEVSENEPNTTFNVLRLFQYSKYTAAWLKTKPNNKELIKVLLAFKCACTRVEMQLSNIGAVIKEFYIKACTSIKEFPVPDSLSFQLNMLESIFNLNAITTKDNRYIKAFNFVNETSVAVSDTNVELPII